MQVIPMALQSIHRGIPFHQLLPQVNQNLSYQIYIYCRFKQSAAVSTLFHHSGPKLTVRILQFWLNFTKPNNTERRRILSTKSFHADCHSTLVRLHHDVYICGPQLPLNIPSLSLERSREFTISYPTARPLEILRRSTFLPKFMCKGKCCPCQIPQSNRFLAQTRLSTVLTPEG